MKRRLLIGSIVALAATIGAAPAVLLLPGMQQRLLAGLTDQVEDRLGVRVRFHDLRPWPPGRVVVHGVRVDQAETTVLNCNSVRLELDVTREGPFVTIARVVLEQPEFQFRQDPDGRWRLPGQRGAGAAGGAAAPSGPGRPVTELDLPPIRVENATIVVLRSDGSTLSLRQVTTTLNVTVSFAAGGAADFRLRLGPLPSAVPPFGPDPGPR